MTWRTIIVSNKAKLSYKNEYMIVRGEDTKMIHLSEISTLIVESTAVSITSYLLAELLKKKVKVIFCDEFRNPLSEIVSYYGAHDSSKRINLQIAWDEGYQKHIWTEVIRQKIINQGHLLKKIDDEEAIKVYDYAAQLELFDPTNREGHAAKKYFTTLFGKGFSRKGKSEINASLNYGYTLLLSSFNREIAKKGYLTQLGLKHSNQFNYFNLSSDLMEPFRIIIDEIVYLNREGVFDVTMKRKLLEIFDIQIVLNGKKHYLNDGIQLYVGKIFKTIETRNMDHFLLYEFQ